ncbi:unnamed protein product [Cylicocyclus nassatus]|uniref:HNH nuclease domain-containing protein n=1 Tax=Cylicocyclus nassatus TaxID=53992 RepID=A0AA36GKF9_CYLNA|nr:unnamed protein product [Cylicocyclus nassatus]
MGTKNESFADFVCSQKFISGEWYLIPYEGKIFNKKHKEVTGCPYQDGDNKRYVIGTKWHGITTHIIKSRAIWIGAHGGVVPSPEMQIDHIDGNTSNDCIDNLRLTTQSQNMGNLATLHKRLGEGNPNAKLTEDDVREIRFYNDIQNVAGKEFIEAYRKQNEIDELKKRLSELEGELQELLAKLVGKQDEVFAVTDLKPYRVVDADYVKANLPAVYSKLIKCSNTSIGKIMSEHYTQDELNQYLANINPDMFQKLSSISVTDLEKELGKQRVKMLEGKGVHIQTKMSSSTKVVLKEPDKYKNPLLENDE